ncbi:hypothetical protein PFDG_04947 [Plasmodium falciparum Dd2]|uniref:Uncharacterized protein n=1 Tax=Plasmodium falciparum (isolate Dd2) TaxID=57267 RepID=A0A0L7M9C7_PLAF4|nr:hypothetical protein PFDG_04947 [Plasmodium falciparum Dd2]
MLKFEKIFLDNSDYESILKNKKVLNDDETKEKIQKQSRDGIYKKKKKTN